MEDKALPIGIEGYKEIIDKEYYYIEKTLFIKEFLNKKGTVNVFTRPCRFGKTLALNNWIVYADEVYYADSSSN